MQESADGTAPRVRRSFLGVSEVAAEAMFDALEQEHAAQVRLIKAEIAREQAECDRLRADVAQLEERLSTARNAVNVLRSKLAQERAARAVLAARLIDQPAIDEAPASTSTADPSFEEIRLDAESQREAEALRDLVERLYRTAYAHGALPAGLEVLIPPQVAAAGEAGDTSTPIRAPARDAAPAHAPAAGQVPEAPAPETEPDRAPPAPVANKERWHSFLVGKLVGRSLTRSDGTVIAREGERITPETVQAVDEAGLLFELILPMRFPEAERPG